VVAVGCTNGSVCLLNLKLDEVLLTFTQKEGPVSSVSFLTDTRLGLSLLASTSLQSGTAVLWDLNGKKIHCELKRPHAGRAMNTVSFLSGEPVLLTSSDDDNSIKMWLLEKGQAHPRLLKERAGHAEAPTKIRFYGGLDDRSARNLLSCGKDGHLRDISLLNEFASMNFSQKKALKSMHDGCQTENGPVKQFGFSQFRERDW